MMYSELKCKIIGKLLKQKFFINFIYKIGGENLLLTIFLLTLDSINQDSSKPAILCLTRLHFQRDVDQLRRDDKFFSYIYIPEDVLGSIQNLWIPPHAQKQTIYLGKDKGNIPYFEKASLFAEKILSKLSEKWNLVSVISGNHDYWQHKSMRLACENKAIIFGVLLREAQTLPRTHDENIEYYNSLNYRADVDFIALASERTQATIKEENVIEANKIHVTGLPRFDTWLKADNDKYKKKYITLLSFFEPLYYADEMFFETLDVLFEVSKSDQAKDLIIKIKCKSKGDKINIKNELKKRGRAYPNFEFSYEVDLKEVYQNSLLVIGYNSLAMIEAVLSKAYLVLPNWCDEAKDPQNQSISPDKETNLHYNFARSPDHMREILLDCITAEDNSIESFEKRISFFNRYFYYSRSLTSSEKFSRLMRKYVQL